MNGASGDSASAAEIGDILQRFENRCEAIGKFVEAYRQYCWPVQSLDDLKLAPFHLLATEGKVHIGPGPSLAHGDVWPRSVATISVFCC